MRPSVFDRRPPPEDLFLSWWSNSPQVMCILCRVGLTPSGSMRGLLGYMWKPLVLPMMDLYTLRLLLWLWLYVWGKQTVRLSTENQTHHDRYLSTLTLSSRPSARMTTMRPWRLRPVRPMRCTRRMGLFWASKQTMRSTSPMSSPSSPTQVDTSVLKPPWRNLCTTWSPNDRENKTEKSN